MYSMGLSFPAEFWSGVKFLNKEMGVLQTSVLLKTDIFILYMYLKLEKLFVCLIEFNDAPTLMGH